MSEWPRGFHQVNQVCPRAFPRRMFTMKYGTQSAMQSRSVTRTAVIMAQFLLAAILYLQAAVLATEA